MEGSRGHGSKEVPWNSSSPIIFILGSTKTGNHSFRRARPCGHATWNLGEGSGQERGWSWRAGDRDFEDHSVRTEKREGSLFSFVHSPIFSLSSQLPSVLIYFPN